MKYCILADDVELGQEVRIHSFVNLYGCSIGDQTRIGAFVEIQKGAVIGGRCKISSHTFICEGVRVEDRVFIGHNVTFINDRYPEATNPEGCVKNEDEWTMTPTIVKKGASIGSGVTIMCGITIGEGAIVGAGSVVLKDIPAHEIWTGNPARFLRKKRRSWKSNF